MSETALRALTGTVYVAVLVAGLTLFQPQGSILLGLLLLTLSWPEAIRLFHLSSKGQLYALLLMAATIGAAYAQPDSLEIPLLAALSLGPLYLLFSPAIQLQGRALHLVLWLAPVVFAWTHSLHQATGARFMLAVFVLIWTNDTFAYLGGRTWGKRKLWEALSPKKTREGFVVGLLTSMAASLAFDALFPGILPPYLWPFAAAMVAVFATLGDLLESKIKRQAGVKDAGTLIPGHGGILDRIDSFLMAWPAAYLCFLIYQNTGS